MIKHEFVSSVKKILFIETGKTLKQFSVSEVIIDKFSMELSVHKMHFKKLNLYDLIQYYTYFKQKNGYCSIRPPHKFSHILFVGDSIWGIKYIYIWGIRRLCKKQYMYTNQEYVLWCMNVKYKLDAFMCRIN